MNKTFIKDILKEHYLKKGEELSALKQAEGHNINSQNFIVTLSSGTQIFVKIFQKYNNTILKKLTIINKLFNKGVNVAEIIQSRNKELYITKDGFLVVVFKCYFGKKFLFTPEEIFSAGENLARLNKELEFVKSTFDRDKLYDDLSFEELKMIKQKAEDSDDFSKKVSSFCKHLPELYESINGLTIDGEKRQLVHLDFRPKNVLFNKNAVEVIFDYDFIITGSRLQSIGFSGDRFSQDAEGMISFFKGYQEVDKTLSTELLELVPVYAKREALSRVNYVLRSHFLNNDKKWDFMWDKHMSILNKMDKMKSEVKNEVSRKQ